MTTLTTAYVPSEDVVRDILGRAFDRQQGGPSERFQVRRRLTMNAISGGYKEHASHVAISIPGTPTRGLVIVDMVYANMLAVDVIGQRPLAIRYTELLRLFIRHAAGAQQVPNGWTWMSAKPVSK